MSMPDKLKLTHNGRLEDSNEWTEHIAALLAAREGLSLTPAHWEILLLMRSYYHAHNISPIKRLLKKEICAKLYEGESKATDAYLDGLFPNGVLFQGTKIAGLPVPMLDAEIEQMHVKNESSKTGQATAPLHFVDTFEFEGKILRVNARGSLAEVGDWNERLAEFMANKEGLQLTPDHWEVIQFLRKFYFSYGIAPMVRLLMKHMRQELGEEKSSQDYLYRLFPGGPAKQGSRIAGLPEPQGCIDT
jgi:tRNA 2-thiouridine synthesizing protein E